MHEISDITFSFLRLKKLFCQVHPGAIHRDLPHTDKNTLSPPHSGPSIEGPVISQAWLSRSWPAASSEAGQPQEARQLDPASASTNGRLGFSYKFWAIVLTVEVQVQLWAPPVRGPRQHPPSKALKLSLTDRFCFGVATEEAEQRQCVGLNVQVSFVIYPET